jgi:hypothetical protein
MNKDDGGFGCFGFGCDSGPKRKEKYDEVRKLQATLRNIRQKKLQRAGLSYLHCFIGATHRFLLG